jgi:hypothetical protein
MRKGRTGSADDLLRRLGHGQIELTHEAFHTPVTVRGERAPVIAE